MARFAYMVIVICKLFVWAVMWGGIVLAIRAIIDGQVFIGVLILLIGVPIALWVSRIILGVIQMVTVLPIAYVVGRSAEYFEYTNFQVAAAEELHSDRLSLRQGYVLLKMFEALPPRTPGEPVREGYELLGLYEALIRD
ncbi:MAG: hypothetical protein ACYDHO_02900 [Gaiellaceae bacterium]